MGTRNTPYTPSRIVDDNIILSIPVYQRLFVWGEKQINKLLDDLYNDYNKDSSQPYYIGAITIWQTKENGGTWEIVDGQQRLTFLALFFAVCKSILGENMGEAWQSFNHPKEGPELRIKYVGRPKDKDGFVNLENRKMDNVNDHLGKKNPGNVNDHFELFRTCFLAFLKEKNLLPGSQALSDFIKYVYTSASFLVVKLPEDYTAYDLNLYFEKLNSTGRQISPVDEIRGMLQLDVGQLKTWNACMDFSFQYTGTSDTKGEDNTSLQEEGKSLQGNGGSLKLQDFLNCADFKPTGDADASDDANRRQFVRSILSPEMFLSHVLYLYQNNTDGVGEQNIVASDNIVSAYREKTNGEGIDKVKLLGIIDAYRKWLDNNIICLGANGNGYYEFHDKSKDNESKDNEKSRAMMVLQSFLYVSSNEKQKWLLEAYLSGNNKVDITSLEEADNRRNPLPRKDGKIDEQCFSYQAHRRYWFFKLDYLLWKKREEWATSPDYKQAVENFVFHDNRSIEHLHPQNPGNENWCPDPDELKKFLHCFGNLALITPSSNSSISNLSVDEKFARIKGRLGQGLGLESLKLLKMGISANFNESEWTPDKVSEHMKKMFDLLGNYYGNTSQK